MVSENRFEVEIEGHKDKNGAEYHRITHRFAVCGADESAIPNKAKSIYQGRDDYPAHEIEGKRHQLFRICKNE